MSIHMIQFNHVDIIYLSFENVIMAEDKIEHIEQINKWINKAKGKALVLINLKGFMPGPGFMDYATSTLNDRASKIKKAAYIGIEKRNMKLFASFDKYNSSIVNRKIFQEEQEALLWLTEVSDQIQS